MNHFVDSMRNAFHLLGFRQLFVFSLVMLLLQAIFYQFPFMYLLIIVLYLNAFLVSLSASGAGGKVRWLMIVLLAISVITRMFAPAGQEALFLVLSKGMIVVLLSVVIIKISLYIATSQRVTSEALFAAVVVYLMIALLFSQLYSIIYALFPGSISFPSYETDLEGRIADIAFNYYSFVTIATLGYGDIAPRHPVAQMLASVEAVIGQFYVAIVVAWLVSLFVAHRETPAGGKKDDCTINTRHDSKVKKDILQEITKL